MTFRLFDHDRGSVVAPAGCGKTQAIVAALIGYTGQPILILTHTNAGVTALKTRLVRAGVSSKFYRLSTIDGWAMRLANTFPRLSLAPDSSQGRVDYPAIRQAALRAISSGALNGPIQATYARLVVDEYQDCSHDQHAIVLSLSNLLKTCVLGDPLQRIFDFRSGDHPDWRGDIETAFVRVGAFDRPWRWLLAGEERFGEWVLSVRPALLNGQSFDLRDAPPNVRWELLPADVQEIHNAHARTINAMRLKAGHGLLIIGDSKNRHSRADVARRMPGLNVVEPVDLTDLIEAAAAIEKSNGLARLQATLEFAKEIMTEIDIRGLGARLNSLQKGTARKPADAVEAACLRFVDDDGMAAVDAVLRALAASSRRTFRGHLLAAMFDALGRVLRRSDMGLREAAVASREQRRVMGRSLPVRAVGSTLLLKGLETEHAIVLNADDIDVAPRF